jgi:hypothetical protein
VNARERAHAFIEWMETDGDFPPTNKQIEKRLTAEFEAVERCNLCDDGKPKVLCSDCGNRMHARGRREALEEAAHYADMVWDQKHGDIACGIRALARGEGE